MEHNIKNYIENKGLTMVELISNLKITHIITVFLLILTGLLLSNEMFLFSNNYKIEKQISYIEKIEDIKEKYNIKDSEILFKLNNLENNILEEKSFIRYSDNLASIYGKGKVFINNIGENTKEDSLIKSYRISKIFNNLLFFLSINFIWIVFGFISLYNLIKGKNKEGMLPLFIFSIIFSVLWYFLFIFLNGLFGTQNILWNIFYNILILSIFGIIGNKSNTPNLQAK